MVHGNTGQSRYSQKTTSAINWLREYVNLVGEPQPDCSFTHLPSYLNKVQLYTEYTEELKKVDNSLWISPSQFYGIWSSHFKDVKIPVQTRLGRCNDCSEIKKQMKTLHNEEEKKHWTNQKKRHLQLVRKERTFLQQRKLTAKVHCIQFIK